MRSFNRTWLALAACIQVMISCQHGTATGENNSSWCDQAPRPGLEKLKEVKTSRPWFRVFEVGEGVLAITEPYQSQEVNSFLVLGKDKALLFDTGMGMDTISALVKELTSLPIIVLNSHTHPDHIGGNHEFDSVWAMNTPYTDKNAKDGYDQVGMRSQTGAADLCLQRIPGLDTAHYFIHPFKIAKRVEEGSRIELGGRTLELLSIPGHTPDAIALLDSAHGYLWTGDSFYLGGIWLFMDGSDLVAYDHSIHRMSALAPTLKSVFPAHNLPWVGPEHLDSVTRAYNDVMMGKVEGEPYMPGTKRYPFGTFSFVLRDDAVKRP